MRELWKGALVTHYGRHYRVENARLYSLPEQPPPVVVSAFGPEATDLAARIGDGYVTTSPDADALASYRSRGGRGEAIAAVKVCWDPDNARARKLAHQLWPTEGLQGQLNRSCLCPRTSSRRLPW